MDIQKRYDTRTGENRDEPAPQPWTTPKLTVIDASEAQGGANPINPEGGFAAGS